MRLFARCLPEYFAMLDEKHHEFRQIECIQIENTETHEMRTFGVRGILRLDDARAGLVKRNYPNVPWDPKLPVFAIELGDEVKIEPATGTGLVEAERHERGEKEYEFFYQKRKENET